MRRRCFVSLGVVVAAAGTPASHAERVPVAVYTMAEGLARDEVGRIVQDSHGFIWFCSTEGLSRFDGTRFQVFGADSGLPSPDVSDLLETRDGAYWVATDEGIYRLDLTTAQPTSSTPLGQPRIERPPGLNSDPVARVLFESSDGALWVGTAGGLYRVDRHRDSVIWTAMPLSCDDAEGFDTQVNAITEDRDGTLWVGTRGCGLQRRNANRAFERVSPSTQLPASMIPALLMAVDGTLWVGTDRGIAQIDTDADSQATSVMRWLTVADGLPPDAAYSLAQTCDGTIYAGTRVGLVQLTPDVSSSNVHVRTLGRAQGLSDDTAISLASDRDGNLWIGTQEAGAMKLTPSGFTGFGPEDGLREGVIAALVPSTQGELLILSRSKVDRSLVLGNFDQDHFNTTALANSFQQGGWGWGETVMRDHLGALWVATSRGVRIYDRHLTLDTLANRPPTRTLMHKDGLPGDDVFRIFEDSRGDVWIAALGPGGGMARWNRATNRAQQFGIEDGYSGGLPAAFAETPDGAVWIGVYGLDGLYCWRAGHLRRIGIADGLPRGGILALHVDTQGGLWLGSSVDGAALVRDPTAKTLQFEHLRTADGLSSNEISAFTEDNAGRIYFGTGRGVDRFDPATRRFDHYSTADGAPSGRVNIAARDANGALWFASWSHVARLIPTVESPRPTPAARIVGLRLGGVAHPLPALGATRVEEVTLASGTRSVEVEFLAPDLRREGALRYRHRLVGAEAAWSEPDTRRAIEYPLLAAGRYQLEIQAVGPDQSVGATATVALHVLPPIWARGWFMALVAMVLVSAAWLLHRQRVARLVALERVRTRIATDLHDDVGASLSRTAILAEVVRRDIGESNPEASQRLDQIARSAREVVDGMADIVWALDPKKDDLGQLVSRLRAFASEILPPSGVTFSVQAPEDAASLNLSLGAEARRQVYLVLKEAITNAARHAHAQHVAISIQTAGGRLEATVEDDGRGLDPGDEASHSPFGGNGLRNMRARVARCHGTLAITSQSDRGTRIALTLPIAAGQPPGNA